MWLHKGMQMKVRLMVLAMPSNPAARLIRQLLEIAIPLTTRGGNRTALITAPMCLGLQHMGVDSAIQTGTSQT